ncbi:MAG TPA: prolipoprotein diacylglyceryl transferase family protein, partial [Gemmataceae bacterium]|nr:prolipoprotein diacylglyceryl transferase family protein [Gemmataceae bacterium]
MHQVLFWIPIKLAWFPNGIPIYGFGTMLFLAFVTCTWLVSRWAYRTGVSRERLQDLAIWIFIFGIIGARIVFMIQYKVPPENFFKIWEGGIVFYGSAIGGWVGYLLGRWWYRKEPINTWKIADMAAPIVCVGLAIGRIGCFLNGCCFGHVCTTDTGICARFPTMTSPARELVVTGAEQRDGTIRNGGYQTLAGFALDERFVEQMPKPPAIVGAVEPNSPAAHAGLQPGDRIEEVNGQPTDNVFQLRHVLLDTWPRGVPSIDLTVRREGAPSPISLKFTPRTLPLYPTQLFETISMVLLFFVLITFFPYRQYYGQVFVFLMMGYAFHRFFNETLRDDTDPVLVLKNVGVYLTLSQAGSILVLASAVVLHFFLRKYSRIEAVSAPVAPV